MMILEEFKLKDPERGTCSGWVSHREAFKKLLDHLSPFLADWHEGPGLLLKQHTILPLPSLGHRRQPDRPPPSLFPPPELQTVVQVSLGCASHSECRKSTMRIFLKKTLCTLPLDMAGMGRCGISHMLKKLVETPLNFFCVMTDFCHPVLTSGKPEGLFFLSGIFSTPGLHRFSTDSSVSKMYSVKSTLCCWWMRLNKEPLDGKKLSFYTILHCLPKPAHDLYANILSSGSIRSFQFTGWLNQESWDTVQKSCF